MKKVIKVRNKPGYKIKDRKCRLCHKIIPVDKAFYGHHIAYPTKPESRGIEVIVNLCWMCHEIVHCRLKFRNPYNEYGRDWAAYKMASDIIRMFNEHPEVVKLIKES